MRILLLLCLLGAGSGAYSDGHCVWYDKCGQGEWRGWV